MGKDLELKIKELEETKAKLEESEEQYKLIVENANDVIFTMDFRGNFLSMNKRSEDISGYTRKELLKMNARQLLDRGSWKVVLKGIKEIIFTKTYNIDELQMRTKNGEIITIDARAALLKIGDKPYSIIVIVRDITERKKYELALRESEEKYRLILENANDAVISVSLKGNLLSANKKAEEISGYKIDELLGINMRRLVPKYYLPKLLLSFGNILHEGKFLQTNVPICTKDKKIVYTEISGSLLKKGREPNVVIGIIRDITERRKYEKELNKEIDALEKYNKIAIGREHKMMELKEKIRELEEKLAEK